MRVLSHEQLLTRATYKDEPLRLRTATDVMPGGYAAAMAPLLIDWSASDIDSENAFVVIQNLNHGGNPVDGTTVLCSAKVPLDGVEAVEFTFLPLDKIGKQGLIQHGQLRFIFAEDKPVLLLNYGDESMGSDRKIQDLVFSWEAWRAPDAGYDVKTGMNPAAYLLSPRVFSGPTRFLDDALGKRDWFSYPLRLPNGPLGLAELLRTNLALCDGVARHTVSKILEQHDIRATFFVIGEHAVGQELLLKRMKTAGHKLGNHPGSDEASIQLSEEEFEQNLLAVEKLIPDLKAKGYRVSTVSELHNLNSTAPVPPGKLLP